ncbi:hypothetical protein IWQ57_003403, partial [Coemansia nantahalensis]
MATLVVTIGACLERLEEGAFGESLAAIDQYCGSNASAASAPPRWVDRIGGGGGDDDGDGAESDAGSVASSFSDVASFRDAPSSPQWLEGAGGGGSHTAASVLGRLRQLVHREESWHRTRATYEDHLAQMAAHLQQQTIELDAAREKLASLGHAGTDAAPADEGGRRPVPTPNWWSTFLPAAAPSGAAAAAAASVAGPPNWSPLAMDFTGPAPGDPAYMAPPTPVAGAIRYPTPNPAFTTVPTTGEVVCIECIQACERVADAVLSGNFDARVRCTRCHAADDGEGDEWPLLGGSGSGAAARTPLIRRPNGHTQRLANRVNRMASLLSFVTREIIEVAHNDGIRGLLGTQGKIDGLRGTWLDLMNEVNTMTMVHTEQARNITHVCNSVANGNLTEKVTADLNGEMLDLKTTINAMVDQLSSFSVEVTRVTHAVGTEGILGVAAEVPGVNGVWKELTDNVNNMADNLTIQVRGISKVCQSVAAGDLTQTINVEARGEMLELKTTINSMVTSLNTMAHEVSRVAVEVGTDGVLGGQANVPNVDGVWKDLTDSVNKMADNLTNQVRDIADVTRSILVGDLTKQVTSELSGEMGELKTTINTMVRRLSFFADEVTRIAFEVGLEGRLGTHAHVLGVEGVWMELMTNLNKMAYNITHQIRTISEVTASVSEGDLSKLVDIPCRGEMGFLKKTINDMVGRLKTFSSEVSRVAREVGTDGDLGGQAIV